MDSDRLDWIFDRTGGASLEQRYDTWAATYAADHDEWGWRGPDMVATAAARHLELGDGAGTGARTGAGTGAGTIVDAGCGTGMVGVALRRAGWTGVLIGLDLSRGMLDEASKSGAYDGLVKCSLYDVPLADDVAVATVSAGVFTQGHVGGSALAELCRISEAGGVVTITQRIDLAEEFAPHIDALVATGAWVELDRTPAEQLHPDRNETLQTAISWRVVAAGA